MFDHLPALRMLLQVSRAFYGKLARLYRTHWLEAAGAPPADSSIGLPMDAAAARLAALEAGQQSTGGGEKGDGSASHDASAYDDDADDEEAGGGTAAAAGAPSHDAVALGAESRIAELEEAAAAAAAGAAESSNGNTSSIGNDSSNLRAEFHQRMFALLLRYKSLQGAGFQVGRGSCADGCMGACWDAVAMRLLPGRRAILHGGKPGASLLCWHLLANTASPAVISCWLNSLPDCWALQAAAGPPVFKLLRDRLAVGFEAFASPLNATFARFGSAFPDVDGPFGSAGSFFRCGPMPCTAECAAEGCAGWAGGSAEPLSAACHAWHAAVNVPCCAVPRCAVAGCL